MPISPDALLEFLSRLGIPTTTIEHPPLHTVEESHRLRGEIPGAHAKNLFVKDKKSRLFVVSMLENTAVDLKLLHQSIGGQGRVSFASAELLEEVWGVRPGSVTPFGAINDKDGRVTQVFDTRLLEYDTLNFHPLTNTRTTTISRDHMLKFLHEVGHDPVTALLPVQT